MSEVTIVSLKPNISYSNAQKSVGLFTFGLLCFRGFLGWIGIETIIFTILINLGIIFSINYTKVNTAFLLVPFLCIMLVVNRQILGIIDLIAMCLILKNESIKKLALIYLCGIILFVPVWMALLGNGLLENLRFFDPKKGEFFSYGFTNPNGLGMLGFHIACCCFILLSPRRLFLSAFLTLILSQVFYYFSASRTPWIGGMVLAATTLMLEFNCIKKWMKYPIAFFPPFITCLCLYISKNIDNYFELNFLVSGRFSIYSSILNNMGLLNWIVGTPLPEGEAMDGSYMMLLFSGGIVTVILFCFLIYRIMIKYYGQIFFYLPFLLSILACGVMENTFSSCRGLSVMFWSLLFYKPKDIKTLT